MLEGSRIVSELIDKDIKVNVLNIGLMDNTPSSKLIRNIFFSFAEFERDIIAERTLEGKYKKSQRDTAIKLLENHSYNEVADMTGISRRTLIRYKKECTYED